MTIEKQDYLAALRSARDPRHAATLIRAFACQVQGYGCHPSSDEERVEAIEGYERQAQILERVENSADAPWRIWLKDWGFV